jgi:hypothetical protein
MPKHSTFSPKDGECALPLNDILSRVVTAFSRSTFNRDVAAAAAAERLKHLTALNAPENILAAYRTPNVVRCRIGDTDSAAYLEFDAWDAQAIIVQAHPDGSLACEALLQKLAKSLNYSYVTEEYD